MRSFSAPRRRSACIGDRGGAVTKRFRAVAVAALSSVVSTAAPASAHAHGLIPRGGPLAASPRAVSSEASSAAASSACSGCTPPLLYNGGPVMGTQTVGENTIYAVYWEPAGHTFSSTFTSVVNGYLQNVAAASGTPGNVFAVASQYYQTTNGAKQSISYLSHFGGEIDVTAAFPSSGCPVATGYSICLTDAQVQSELQSLVTSKGLPADLGHLYGIMLPSGVETCMDSTANTCSSNVFCGYHSGVGSAGREAL